MSKPQQRSLPKINRFGSIEVIFILFAAMTVCLSIVLFLYFNQPKQRYFAVTKAGKGYPAIPLKEPNISSKALLRWASLAATTAYTMDFFHYEDTLNSLKDFFTKSGYDGFLAALKNSGRLDAITNQRLTVAAVLSGVPVILKEGIDKGYYSWNIQLPLLVTYQGASERTKPQEVVVQLTVSRVPTTESLKGIGIVEFITQGQLLQ